MTIEQVRQLYNTAPFKPCIIHLADGRQTPVKHCEFMVISPSGRTVVHQSNDTSDIIDLLLVTDLEIRNGKPRKNHCSQDLEGEQMDLEGAPKAPLKRPFQPFKIRLTDGQSLTVWHPGAVGERRIIVVQSVDSRSVAETLPIAHVDRGA